MPYMAQGAAQATEDAAALAACLARFEDMPEALGAYERQRKPRAAYVARNTRVLQEWLHLYDGPERDRRDEMMKVDGPENPIYWGDSTRKEWLFGYDAREVLGKGEEVWIPDLPPMPRDEARVYLKSEENRARL